jgi:Mn2+/Fe2+ NRAMP family transporter
MQRIKKFLKILGPGIISGAADDDPSGIATYSQTGAQFGLGQLWFCLYILPFLIAVQEACARIGAVTGKGLTAVIKDYYGKRYVYVVVTLILVANTINLGADIGSMAASVALIVPLNLPILAISFSVLILILEIFTSYKVYSRVLKFLSLAILAYVFSLFLIPVAWNRVILATFIPHFELTFSFLFIITGLIGTTISPYMFFWQASEETEEEKAAHLIRRGKVYITWKFIKDLRLDTLIGMFFSQLGSWSITIVAATVLFTHGIRDIGSAADAAKALEPLVSSFPNSGYLAKILFASGVVGLGLLAIPVLSASAAYAFSEAFNMHEGLNLRLKQAHGFYGIMIISTLIGLAINFIGIDPIRALVIAAVVNGIVAVPLLFVIAKVAANEKIMGKYKSGNLSKIFVWSAFLLAGMAAISMIFLFFVR